MGYDDGRQMCAGASQDINQQISSKFSTAMAKTLSVAK